MAASAGLSKYEFNKDLKCTDAYLYRQMGKDEMYARVGPPPHSSPHRRSSLAVQACRADIHTSSAASEPGVVVTLEVGADSCASAGRDLLAFFLQQACDPVLRFCCVGLKDLTQADQPNVQAFQHHLPFASPVQKSWLKADEVCLWG